MWTTPPECEVVKFEIDSIGIYLYSRLLVVCSIEKPSLKYKIDDMGYHWIKTTAELLAYFGGLVFQYSDDKNDNITNLYMRGVTRFAATLTLLH